MSTRKTCLLAIWSLIGLCCIIAVPYSVRFHLDGIEREKSTTIAKEVAERLWIGMSQEEAEKQLRPAWRHYQCGSSIHVYLFGSRNMNLAANLSLLFKEQNGTNILVQIASEDTYGRTLSESCQFEDK